MTTETERRQAMDAWLAENYPTTSRKAAPNEHKTELLAQRMTDEIAKLDIFDSVNGWCGEWARDEIKRTVLSVLRRER